MQLSHIEPDFGMQRSLGDNRLHHIIVQSLSEVYCG